MGEMQRAHGNADKNHSESESSLGFWVIVRRRERHELLLILNFGRDRDALWAFPSSVVTRVA